MKRVAKHKVSKRIDGWSAFFTVLGILAVVAGAIAFIAGLSEGDNSFVYGLGVIFIGLCFFATAKMMEGFSIVVRKAEQELVDMGDDAFLDPVASE